MSDHFPLNLIRCCNKLPCFLPTLLCYWCSPHYCDIWTPCISPSGREMQCSSNRRKGTQMLVPHQKSSWSITIRKDGPDARAGSESLHFTDCWEGINSHCTCSFLILSLSILCWPLLETGCLAGRHLLLNSHFALKIECQWRLEGFLCFPLFIGFFVRED